MPTLKSDHLDIKDTQCAETKDLDQKVQKDGQKIKFSSKVTKFAGKIGIDLTLIFSINDFCCAILSF